MNSKIALAFLIMVTSWKGVSVEAAHRDDVLKSLPSGAVLVAWLDISKVEVEETLAFMQEQGMIRTDPKMSQQVAAMQDALKQLGVTRVYYASNLNDLPEMRGRLIVPSSNPQATQLLLGSLAQGLGGSAALEFKTEGEITVGTPAGSVQGTGNGEPEAELLASLQANESDHGVVFATPPQVSMTLLGILRSSVAGENVSEMARMATVLAELRSLSLEATIPPSSFELCVKNKSAAAAGNLAEYLNEQVEKKIPKLAADLSWSSDGMNTVLSANSAEATAKRLAAAKRLFSVRSGVTANSMKQIALAMHNYAAANNHLPPQCIVDKDGNRLLSWRVLILPYLDQKNLYKQFHLNEPWDSEHNLKVAATVPFPYASAENLTQKVNGVSLPLTQMVAPLTKDSAFGRPGGPMRFRNFMDGTSNTIWFVETTPQNAVPWTKPVDLPIDTAKPTKSIAGDNDGFFYSRVDGSVGYVSSETSDKVINALITIDGGEVIDNDDVK